MPYLSRQRPHPPAGEDKPRRVTGRPLGAGGPPRKRKKAPQWGARTTTHRTGSPSAGRLAARTRDEILITEPATMRLFITSRFTITGSQSASRASPGNGMPRVSARVPGWSPDQAISRLAIVKAIRPGSKRARDQRRYLRAVLADPVIAALRADRRRAVLEVARILARHANWQDMTSWRPRERVWGPRKIAAGPPLSPERAARRGFASAVGGEGGKSIFQTTWRGCG